MESQRQQSVWDFPGGSAVQSPCTARDAGSAPGQGTKIPQAMEQLSPCTTATEPACSRACVPQLQSPCATRPDAAK